MERIALGRICSSHGVRGKLKIKSFSGNTEHFLALKEVCLKKGEKERSFDVEAVELAGQAVLIKLKGINTPEEGKLYAAWDLWADRSYAQALSEGEYYFSDLCGCSLQMDGRVRGVVKNLCEGGNGTLLEVEHEKGTSFVPFLEMFIGEVDVKGKRIELKVDWFF